MKLLSFGVAALALAALPGAVMAADTDVVINEFLPNPVGGDNGNRSEWIELYNNGATAVDLSGYKVQGKSSGTPTISELPAGTVIGPGEYLILAGHKHSFTRGKYQRIDESKVVDLNWPYASEISNSNGYIAMYRPEESIPYLEINHRTTAPWPAGAIGSDISYELNDPSLDPDDGANWSFSPADPDGILSGSPLRPNSALNTTNIEITGGVRDVQYPASTDVVTVAADITADTVPTSIELMVDTGSGYAPVAMTNTTGDTYTAQIPSVSAGTLVKHYVKVTDANGYFRTQPYYTPEVFFVDDNFPTDADLTITEIMYNPQGSDNGTNSEWVEVLNRRSTPIDVSYYLWGNHTETINNRIIPEGTIIPGNSYLILAGQKPLFTAQYPGIDPNIVIDAQWNIGASILSNSNDGSAVTPLVHANAVDWNDTRIGFEGIPYMVVAPWPVSQDGVSIQLDMTKLDENEIGENWLSAGVGNETPAATNVVAGVDDWSIY